MKYYMFNMGDYAEKAAHLTWDEDAAYRKMLDWYYSMEGPLPTDTRAIYRKMKADTEDRRAACDAVLAEFFSLTEQGFSHEKCDERLAKFYNVSKSASARGKAGAEIKKAKAKLKEDVGKLQLDDKKQKQEIEEKTPSLIEASGVFEGEEGLQNQSADQNSATAKLEGSKDKLQLGKDKQPITHNPLPITHVVARENFQILEIALSTIAELANQPVKTNPDVSPIFKLVQRGFDIQTEIVPVIRNSARKARPASIRSWGYFVTSIEDGRIERPTSNGHTQPVINEAEWADRLKVARRMKSWDKNWGPFPNTAGCLAPPAIIQPSDGQDWAVWDAKK